MDKGFNFPLIEVIEHDLMEMSLQQDMMHVGVIFNHLMFALERKKKSENEDLPVKFQAFFLHCSFNQSPLPRAYSLHEIKVLREHTFIELGWMFKYCHKTNC